MVEKKVGIPPDDQHLIIYMVENNLKMLKVLPTIQSYTCTKGCLSTVFPVLLQPGVKIHPNVKMPKMTLA